MSSYVQYFRDLDVYKKQREVSNEVFRLSKEFPSEEKFSISDQIRRSSRSVGAQIAEAWAKRLYPKQFTSKLADADGEQLETQHWLIEALDCEYLSHKEYNDLTQNVRRLVGCLVL